MQSEETIITVLKKGRCNVIRIGQFSIYCGHAVPIGYRYKSNFVKRENTFGSGFLGFFIDLDPLQEAKELADSEFQHAFEKTKQKVFLQLSQHFLTKKLGAQNHVHVQK